MKKTNCIILTFIILLSISFIMFSQNEDKKIGVSVDHSGDDSVGELMAFSIRDAIRGSNTYKIVAPDHALFFIKLVTLDPDDPGSGHSTIASVVFTMTNLFPYDKKNPQTWYQIYLTSSVLICGSSKVETRAKSILAALDSAVERFRSDARN